MPLPRWPLSAVLGAASLACSDTKPFRSFSWEERDRKGAVFLTFDSASASSFSAADGRPCRAATRFNVLGWESNPDREQPACTHDTLEDGVGTASLELRFRGTIPGNGDYEINTFDNGLRIWVDVLSRGSWVGDSVSNVRVAVEARSPHCSLTWISPVAKTATFGPETREMPYGGYKEIPPLRLERCKRGEPLEVRTSLIADSNRGRVDVDSFGFRAASAEEADRVMAIVFREGEGPRHATRCTPGGDHYCSYPVLTGERTAPDPDLGRNRVNGMAPQPHR